MLLFCKWEFNAFIITIAKTIITKEVLCLDLFLFTTHKTNTFFSHLQQKKFYINIFLASRVNFINFLRAALKRSFYAHRYKMRKEDWYLDCLFALLGSGVNFINILCSNFVSVDPKRVKRYWQLDWISYAFESYTRKSCA